MSNHLQGHRLAWLTVFLLLCGLPPPLVFAQPDPAVPGLLAVTRAEYDFGDMAFTPTDFPGPVEVRASVHHPTDLSSGPFPLVLFLHGRHDPCFAGSMIVRGQWPCPPGFAPIPSFQGYNYISGFSLATAILWSLSVPMASMPWMKWRMMPVCKPARNCSSTTSTTGIRLPRQEDRPLGQRLSARWICRTSARWGIHAAGRCRPPFPPQREPWIAVWYSGCPSACANGFSPVCHQ